MNIGVSDLGMIRGGGTWGESSVWWTVVRGENVRFSFSFSGTGIIFFRETKNEKSLRENHYKELASSTHTKIKGHTRSVYST